MRSVTIPSFFDGANKLRSQFEEVVGPNRIAEQNRFVWDYWHIPGQYTYFRTLALNVIRPSLVGEFVAALSDWGLANLGTSRVTSPWLSFYVDGCRQELHSDVVQGMWSYVYSLSPWEDRRFTGGETLLGSELLLNYWAKFNPEKSSESRHLIERIPAHFNQLCVFDSRLPHGVASLEGTRDPLQARVALHGWFHDPELSLKGSLSLQDAEATLDGIRARWKREKHRIGRFHGQATWRLSIGPQGNVEVVELVADSFVSLDPEVESCTELVAAANALIGESRFPLSQGVTTLILPLA